MTKFNKPQRVLRKIWIRDEYSTNDSIFLLFISFSAFSNSFLLTYSLMKCFGLYVTKSICSVITEKAIILWFLSYLFFFSRWNCSPILATKISVLYYYSIKNIFFKNSNWILSWFFFTDKEVMRSEAKILLLLHMIFSTEVKF